MFAPEVKQRLQASYVSAINYVLSGSGNWAQLQIVNNMNKLITIPEITGSL
jgi:hypothetical protein